MGDAVLVASVSVWKLFFVTTLNQEEEELNVGHEEKLENVFVMYVRRGLSDHKWSVTFLKSQIQVLLLPG